MGEVWVGVVCCGALRRPLQVIEAPPQTPTVTSATCVLGVRGGRTAHDGSPSAAFIYSAPFAQRQRRELNPPRSVVWTNRRTRLLRRMDESDGAVVRVRIGVCVHRG
jgi:hypothetical protein